MIRSLIDGCLPTRRRGINDHQDVADLIHAFYSWANSRR
jgi:hypothetical protein